MKLQRGFTLAEVLIAASLLLLVTAITLGVLTNTYRRALLLEQKHDTLQRFILARNYLTKRLLNSNLQVASSSPQRLVFLLAAGEATAYGQLHRVSSTEMTQWLTDRPQEVTIETRGAQKVLVDKGGGSPPRTLWVMGEVGELKADLTRLPLLDITLSTTDRDRRPWSRTFTLRVENYQ